MRGIPRKLAETGTESKGNRNPAQVSCNARQPCATMTTHFFNGLGLSKYMQRVTVVRGEVLIDDVEPTDPDEIMY